MEPQAISISTSPTSVAPQNNKTPRMRFRSIEELFQAINNISRDYLVVTNVSPDDFAQISREREKFPSSLSQKRRIFRLRRYYANTSTLAITIPTRLHEALHLHLYRECERKMGIMGLWNSWEPIGSATFRPQGHPGDGGEGDSTGGPDPERATVDAWPTFVIEAGDSEPLGELRRDMRWWFSASDHQVKIVLLAKFEHTRREILIEKWEEDLPFRPGATATRQSVASTALEPVLRQNITILQNAATNPVSYHVTRGALLLSFRLLFLRNPGPQEGDIIIGLPELEHYAEKVWRHI
ncbi:hypothetical protein F5B21DRAFT_465191 [Xylaria acuta]|nr:hypothetical protein F5B21DRAFT_465191 [Xylaria acuta]